MSAVDVPLKPASLLMKPTTTYDQLEQLGRVRLSRNFFMRDFLHSEIAAWHQLRNLPDDPDAAIAVGSRLCEELLEPLQATFGRVHVRSGYRSPTVNEFGNRHGLNCASNEANRASHIWDQPDERGRGATACIVLPWLVDHVERGGRWTDMAWWIHDHLSYSKLYFFPRLAAFNVSWHERPLRVIKSYAEPKGCLTRPGMANHTGSHAVEYAGFPVLVRPQGTALPQAVTDRHMLVPVPVVATLDEVHPAQPTTVRAQAPAPARAPTQPVLDSRPGRPVCYRAVHIRTAWRRVNSHQSLQAAIHGKDGAAALFSRKARVDYDKYGDPLWVLVWERGAAHGYAVRPDPLRPGGIRLAQVPMARLLEFDTRGEADLRWLEQLF